MRYLSMLVLFLIVIGGLFYPILGYLVVAMMAFFLPLSVFKGRWWCWHLCPRGSFLDIVISKVSPSRPTPAIFARAVFRWAVFASFIAFLAWRIYASGGSLLAVGTVFVTMCLVTTIISILLGVTMKHRAWCAICPMGTLQETLGKINKKK